ncbi:MAG: diguanylate cyclase [Clostridia bacterium]|nr:diguanylate cyclase [Clostridia bacterium]
MKAFVTALKLRYKSADLETRILMTSMFAGMVLCFLSAFMNIAISLGPIVIAFSFVMGFCYMSFIYLLVIKNQYRIVAYAALLLPTLLIFPVLWFNNGGLAGSIPYFYILMILLSAVLLHPLKYRSVALIQLSVIFGLIYAEIQYPELITPYATRQAQIIDLTFSVLVIILVIFLLLRYIMREYHRSIEDLKKIKAELESTNQTLHQSAITDTLTSIHNRRYIMDQLNRIIDQTPLEHGLLMIDIDHFKAINDTYGHDVGDQVLITISQLLKRNLPEETHLARIGGEEFLAILDCTQVQRCDKLAEHLRQTISSYVWHIPTLRVTVSIGMYTMHPGDIAERALKYVDIALYDAKKMGKNQVVVYQST